MRILTFLLLFSFLSILPAQDNLKFNKDHRIIEAERKAKALEKSINIPSALDDAGRGFDVHYYGLTLDISPQQKTMHGQLILSAVSKQMGLTDIRLDFQSYMMVDSVVGITGDLEFAHGNGNLIVTLEKDYATDENFSFTLYYHGRTDFGGTSVFGLSFGHTRVFGREHIWSLSEPYGARDWWPCKDTPLDKADSMDIIYKVPEGMIAVGNGKLISDVTEGGKTTFHWKTNYPIATYLVSIAAYPYQRYDDKYISQSGDTLPIMFFVAPENYNGSLQNFGLVSGMIEVFADIYGEYPFMDEKYGHAEASIGGGMEHQTITTLGPIQFNDGFYSEGLISHELAHQWWGDMVTCASFHDIWLNEGFATYSEALLAERVYGQQAYHNYIDGEAYYGPGSIYVNDTTNSGRIFDTNLSYSKAGFVLHMLRGVIGDEIFFDIMKAWYSNASTKYKSAYTKDFQNVCEQVSGMDLEKFFQQWIYGEYFPHYSYGFKSEETEGGFNITLYIDQRQDNTGLFWMPIDVVVITESETYNFVVWDSLESQQFSFFVQDEPENVLIDPDNWILKKTTEKLIDPDLDQGTLLVNGMSWSRSGVLEAYEDKAFWGSAPITFWDISGEPNDGYPESISVIEGQGDLYAQKLGKYSTIIWLSSNTSDDRDNWNDLPIADYLEAGGNIILITQSGSSFINDNLKDYLGISWDEQENLYVQNFISSSDWLSDMDLLGNMAFISGFDTVLTKETSTLLFKTTEGFDQAKGVGVWSHPAEGGNFVYVAARPWMLDHQQIKDNMIYMLDNFMSEPVVSIDDKNNSQLPKKFEISKIYPNPFNPSTQIDFSLPQQGDVTIKVFNVLGSEVAELTKNKMYRAGKHSIQWQAGNMASGLYFVQMKANKKIITKKAILMK